MNNGLVDLHTHSTASDGTLTPTELMRAAAEVGLAAIALTDHDTCNGIAEAQAEVDRLGGGVRLITGIEISATFPGPGVLHILGHFVDPLSPALKEISKILLAGRNERNPKIVRRLNELGCRISMEQVEEIARRGVPEAGGGKFTVGRPHIAQALVANGSVASIKQAFDVYLGTTGAAYFDKEMLTPRQAFECIHKAGGLATVAHPVQLKAQNTAHFQTIINHLVEAGLDGIEVWHSDHTERDVAFLLEMAKRYDLVTTGGSDFHGRVKEQVALGVGKNNVRVPVEVLERLEERWRVKRSAA